MSVPHSIMTQSARKQVPLSLVPAAPEHHDEAPLLNDFFNGWLTSVSSTLTTSSQPTRLKKIFGKLPLTSTDVTRVNRATVRESVEHRHWPPDVVQTFMQADVIKRKR